MSDTKIAAQVRNLIWHPIETAPKEGRFDIWAKRWDVKSDAFEYRRFPDCFARAAYLANLPKDWRATHWMAAPPPPDGFSAPGLTAA